MLRPIVASALCLIACGSLQGAQECLAGDLECVAPLRDVEILEADIQSQDSSINLLQAGSKELKKKQRLDIDPTAVWDQLKGSVDIEEIQEQLSKVADSSQADALKEQLEKLQAQFPDADAIKAQFSDQWDDIKQAVDLDTIQEQMESATGISKDALQEKYDELVAKHPDLSIDSMKDKATDMWGQMKDKLPDLDDLKAKAKEKAKEMASKVGDALKDKLKEKFDKFGLFR